MVKSSNRLKSTEDRGFNGWDQRKIGIRLRQSNATIIVVCTVGMAMYLPQYGLSTMVNWPAKASLQALEQRESRLILSQSVKASSVSDTTQEYSQDPRARQEAPPPPPPPPPESPSGRPPIIQSAEEPQRTLAGVTSDELTAIERYLPAGARIYTYPVSESTLASALITADLDGDGKAETIVVYNDRKPTAEEGSLPLTLSVLVRNKRDLAVRSSVRLSGGVFFSPSIRGLGPPLAVRDVTGDERPEIIVVSGGGASLGGALQVLSFEGSSLHELARIGGHFFRVRSGGKGKPSIITARSRFETTRRRYQWTGKTFEEGSRRPPK